MQHLSIRFLIGLSKPDDVAGFAARFPAVADARASSALAILSNHYPILSAVRGTGYWDGAPEPSLVVEIIVADWGDERGKAEAVAGILARDLGQTAVGLAVVRDVEWSLEGPAAEGVQ
jgi:hypothetical protein